MSKKNALKENTSVKINKTYKIFIGGKFPRTESGRYYPLRDSHGKLIANICESSRKDFRDAVVTARSAQNDWQDRSAYNKSQIIYRIAEMLQQKESLFIDEMVSMSYSEERAQSEFRASVDLLVYYAGWCDKYVQVFSSVNPVASSHFNFSIPEPMGIVATFASASSALLGVVQACIPPICGGNTSIVLASSTYPLCAISFAEVIATSDVPGGVVNILTGKREELLHQFASHMDVNSFCIWDASSADSIEVGSHASENVKRVKFYDSKLLESGSPEMIMAFQEIKTTWHPIENIKGSKSGY